MVADGFQDVATISISRWDCISIIESNLSSLPLWEQGCQLVFSLGWVKLGANPSRALKTLSYTHIEPPPPHTHTQTDTRIQREKQQP